MTLTGLCRTLFAPAALAIVACSDPSGPSPKQIDALPRSLTASEQKLIAGGNTFAFDLLREINAAQRSTNVFVSPISASMALGMATTGAAGTTFEAMRGALRLGQVSRSEVNEGYKSLIALLRGLDAATEFRIANSIWYEKTFPFDAAFLADAKSFFDASVTPLDFRSSSAAGTINSWVSESTNKKIPSIVDAIDPAEVMFLINAIYFKGSWQKQFDKSQTTDATFFAYDGTTSKVPMMHQKVPLRKAFGAGYTAVDLLYGNSAFAMTIVLPNPGEDVNTLAEKLTPAAWQTLEKSFFESETDFYLPRFKLEWKRLLNPDLTALGMGIAFSDAANFSVMSPTIPVLLTKVLQKTYVEVNEEGTVAAAATSVGVGVTSAPAAVRVDRPFVLVIRERFSGSILFIGKIVKLPG